MKKSLTCIFKIVFTALMFSLAMGIARAQDEYFGFQLAGEEITQRNYQDLTQIVKNKG